jgi:hypothetical protein
MDDTNMRLTGVASGDGTYTYTAVNSSSYELSVTIGGQTQPLAQGQSTDFTLAASTAYFDFSGGNVTFTSAGNMVIFADRS